MKTGEPITIDRAHAVQLAEAIADVILHTCKQIKAEGDIGLLPWVGGVCKAWHNCPNLPPIPTIGEREATLAWDEALNEEA